MIKHRLTIYKNENVTLWSQIKFANNNIDTNKILFVIRQIDF